MQRGFNTGYGMRPALCRAFGSASQALTLGPLGWTHAAKACAMACHKKHIGAGGCIIQSNMLHCGLLFCQARRLKRGSFWADFLVEDLFPEFPGKSVTCFDFAMLLRCFACAIPSHYSATPAT